MSSKKDFINGLKNGQKSFGDNISAIINTTLLSVVYIVGVGSTSIVAKIFDKKFLDLKIDKNKISYWDELNLDKKPIEEYYRQF